MIMWAAPVGAFGAMAAVVGETGVDALKSLAVIMIGFYVTCSLFVFVILGTLLRLSPGVNIFSLLKYLGREFLLILSTSSSESALPRLIAKMEHLGVQPPGRRHHRPDGLLVQPRRHRDLPDDVVPLHRRRAWTSRCRSASRSRCCSS